VKTKEEKLYPMDIKEIQQMPKDKVIGVRIGTESDTYL
jgi:hypothetical protein